MTDIQALDSRYVAHTYARVARDLGQGQGAAACMTMAGKAYIDMGSGIAVNALGYGDEGWVAAVSAHGSGSSPHASNLYHTAPLRASGSDALCERTGLKRVFFGNSGAEANECAIKAARRYGASQARRKRAPRRSSRWKTASTAAPSPRWRPRGRRRSIKDFGPFYPAGFRLSANDGGRGRRLAPGREANGCCAPADRNRCRARAA